MLPVTGWFSSLSESGFIPTIRLGLFFSEDTKEVLISFREWLHSYRDHGEVFCNKTDPVLISFREWLHSYGIKVTALGGHPLYSSHLFQRVASFLPKAFLWCLDETQLGSHLFQRVASFLLNYAAKRIADCIDEFSSLSESGFIPTFLFQFLMVFKQSAKFSSLSESGFIPTSKDFRI